MFIFTLQSTMLTRLLDYDAAAATELSTSVL